MVTVWSFAGFVGLCLLQAVWAEDPAFITIVCPATFQNAKVNYISCTTLRAADMSKYCSNVPKKGSFKIRRTSSQYDMTVGAADYPKQASECTATPESLTDQHPCACTGFNNSAITFTLRYVGNQTTDAQARMTCGICLRTSSARIQQHHCDKIKFPGGGGGAVKSSVLGILMSAVVAALMRNWMPHCL